MIHCVLVWFLKPVPLLENDGTLDQQLEACRTMPQRAAACRSMPQHATASQNFLGDRWCLAERQGEREVKWNVLTAPAARSMRRRPGATRWTIKLCRALEQELKGHAAEGEAGPSTLARKVWKIVLDCDVTGADELKDRARERRRKERKREKRQRWKERKRRGKNKRRGSSSESDGSSSSSSTSSSSSGSSSSSSGRSSRARKKHTKSTAPGGKRHRGAQRRRNLEGHGISRQHRVHPAGRPPTLQKQALRGLGRLHRSTEVQMPGLQPGTLVLRQGRVGLRQRQGHQVTGGASASCPWWRPSNASGRQCGTAGAQGTMPVSCEASANPRWTGTWGPSRNFGGAPLPCHSRSFSTPRTRYQSPVRTVLLIHPSFSSTRTPESSFLMLPSPTFWAAMSPSSSSSTRLLSHGQGVGQHGSAAVHGGRRAHQSRVGSPGAGGTVLRTLPQSERSDHGPRRGQRAGLPGDQVPQRRATAGDGSVDGKVGRIPGAAQGKPWIPPRHPCVVSGDGRATQGTAQHPGPTLSSAVPELWFSSSGGVCVCVRACVP